MTSADHAFSGVNIVRNKAIGNRRSDPLPRLLAQLVARAGDHTTIERAASRPWASGLFQGRRHDILLHIDAPDAAERRTRFADGLSEVEWTLVGHFVADILIDDSRSGIDEEWLELSALTIEDW